MNGSIRGLAILALVATITLNACTSAPAPQAPATDSGAQTSLKPASDQPVATKADAKPQAQPPTYGGTLNVALVQDVTTWDDATQGGPGGMSLVNQELWGGDWTKGSAGGFGTNETDWGINGYDLFDKKAGYIAETWKVNIDNEKQQGSIVYQIRPGVHWALNPKSDASKLVGGRELTADDVLTSIKQATTDSKAYIYRGNPELRNVDVAQTGPMEITVKVPLSNLVTALSRFGDSLRIYPAEIRDKMADWKNSVGTGPFMLTDYKTGSSITFAKNPNYWMKDPVGPGKGNQLPYLDVVQEVIIPDPSTRLAAFRTAKIDQINALNWEDANQVRKEFPQMGSAEGDSSVAGAGYMRTDKAPYNDIRVRRALMMATDFNTIKETVNGGLGKVITFPYDYYKEYKDLYVDLDDPDLPPSVKEQYIYNPEKAKQLLADAGYPNGFKSSILVASTEETTFYEMIASMWAKVGVQLAVDVKDPTVRTNLVNTQAYDHMTSGPGKGPVAIYYSAVGINGTPSSSINMSFVNDPYVKETLPKIRVLAATDEKQAMKLSRELTKYALEQAWAIPRPSYRTLTFWWPWLKNYSGETSVGYFNALNWTQWVWVDQKLKQSMGH